MKTKDRIKASSLCSAPKLASVDRRVRRPEPNDLRAPREHRELLIPFDSLLEPCQAIVLPIVRDVREEVRLCEGPPSPVDEAERREEVVTRLEGLRDVR